MLIRLLVPALLFALSTAAFSYSDEEVESQSIEMEISDESISNSTSRVCKCQWTVEYPFYQQHEINCDPGTSYGRCSCAGAPAKAKCWTHSPSPH